MVQGSERGWGLERIGSGAGTGRGGGADHAEEIDVANSKLASPVHDHTPDLCASDQIQPRLRDAGPLLPAASLRDGDRPGTIDAVDLDVEDSTRASCRNPNLQVVGTCRRHVDRVFQPLTCGDPAEVVAAAGIGGCFDVDVSRAVHAAGVSSSGI